MRVLIFTLTALVVSTSTGCAALSASRPESSPTAISQSQPVIPTPSPIVLTLAPPSNCPHLPLGGFNEVWRNDQVWPRLGCAVAPAESVSGTEAYLRCMHSLWLSQQHRFIAVPYPLRGWSFIPDESGIASDAPLMVMPYPLTTDDFAATGRHGWLANQPPYSQECAGRSRSGETPFEGQIQQFQGGWLLWNGNVCFVFFEDGTWTMF